jgi:single-stranded DNA-binding protein
VLAFSDTAQAELLRLDDGDAVSVQGALRAEAYSKDGEARVGLTVIADAVLPLRRAKKRQEPEQRMSGPQRMMLRFRFERWQIFSTCLLFVSLKQLDAAA